jgi:hypothetical protein
LPVSLLLSHPSTQLSPTLTHLPVFQTPPIRPFIHPP